MSAPESFAVEAAPGSNVRVSWTEDGQPFWFLADYNGDTLGAIQARDFGRSGPVICTRDPKRKSNSLTTFPASDPRFADVIAFARREIAERKLITAAVGAREARRAEREGAQIRDKAMAVREALLTINIAAVEALASTPDDALAKVYDRIQNSAL